jgi:hypothetical protein
MAVFWSPRRLQKFSPGSMRSIRLSWLFQANRFLSLP